jgi:hypothetical protein
VPDQTRLAAMTRSYFVALNQGMRTGDFSGLTAILALGASLVERSMLPREAQVCCAVTVRGRSAIARFYRRLTADLSGTHWVVGVRNQVSPTTVVAYAHAGGTRGTPPVYSMQRLVVRSSQITSLDLTLYYLQ